MSKDFKQKKEKERLGKYLGFSGGPAAKGQKLTRTKAHGATRMMSRASFFEKKDAKKSEENLQQPSIQYGDKQYSLPKLMTVDVTNFESRDDITLPAQARKNSLFLLADNMKNSQLSISDYNKKTAGLSKGMAKFAFNLREKLPSKDNQEIYNIEFLPVVTQKKSRVLKENELKVADIDNSFVTVYQTLLSGNYDNLIIPEWNQIPAFFGAKEKTKLQGKVEKHMQKRFDELKEFCAGKLSVDNLDPTLQEAVRAGLVARAAADIVNSQNLSIPQYTEVNITGFVDPKIRDFENAPGNKPKFKEKDQRNTLFLLQDNTNDMKLSRDKKHLRKGKGNMANPDHYMGPKVVDKNPDGFPIYDVNIVGIPTKASRGKLKIEDIDQGFENLYTEMFYGKFDGNKFEKIGVPTWNGEPAFVGGGKADTLRGQKDKGVDLAEHMLSRFKELEAFCKKKKPFAELDDRFKNAILKGITHQEMQSQKKITSPSDEKPNRLRRT